MTKPKEFDCMRGFIYDTALKYLGAKWAGIYAKMWNPINYALIGGIGVVVNYLVWILLSALAPWMPWWLVNGIAIITAWSWNWGNSVGPLGWVWGFKKKGVK